ncbi:MAG: ferritin family protein [Candidatus Brockarchaeota archaeon]|nr:ferritin family protein [Candidatus Brockarchaeota archaeon]
MTFRYSLRDLVEMAIQIEIGGEKYYRYVADKNEPLKHAFLFLAEEEKKHANTFQNLIGEQQEVPGIDVAEAMPYIRAIIDSSVLRYVSERTEFAEQAGSVLEALDFALGLEKESILFYYQLLERIPGNRKPTVEKIIGEEKKHVEKIMDLKRSSA